MKKQKQLKQQKKGEGGDVKYAGLMTSSLKVDILVELLALGGIISEYFCYPPPLLQTESISGLCPGCWESLTKLQVLMKYFSESWTVTQSLRETSGLSHRPVSLIYKCYAVVKELFYLRLPKASG